MKVVSTTFPRGEDLTMKEEIIRLIIGSLHDLHGHSEGQVQTELAPDTPLFGDDGMLDSLGLVTLVVAVEQAIESKFGASVNLADERALSQTDSPYRTVRSLAKYACRLIRHEM